MPPRTLVLSVLQGKKARAGDSKRWTLSEVQEFLHRLVQFGQGRLERVREEASGQRVLLRGR